MIQNISTLDQLDELYERYHGWFFGIYVLAGVEECDLTIDDFNNMQGSFQISGVKHKLAADMTCRDKRKKYPLRKRTKPNIIKKINKSYYEKNKCNFAAYREEKKADNKENDRKNYEKKKGTEKYKEKRREQRRKYYETKKDEINAKRREKY